MVHCNFSPASPDEETVYGACRPGYHSNEPLADAVEDWIAEMRAQEIEHVCCLLDEGIRGYDDLLGTYRTAFGCQNVCHAPIEEFGVVSAEMLHGEILPFLREADSRGEKVVVHCAAGSGRTGQILVSG